MKNVLIVILIVAILIFALLCFNSCRKNSEKDENISETVSTISEIENEENTSETNSETSAITEQAENTDQTSVETTSAIDGSESGSGNPDVYDVIKITVSEDKYFYENSEITLDKFKEITESMDANTTVEIRDELATYKAYSALIDYLNEKGILYSEEEE